MEFKQRDRIPFFSIIHPRSFQVNRPTIKFRELLASHDASRASHDTKVPVIFMYLSFNTIDRAMYQFLENNVYFMN